MDAPGTPPAAAGAVSGGRNSAGDLPMTGAGLGGLTDELWTLVYSSPAVALRDVLLGRAVCRGFRAALRKALRGAVLDRPLSQADLADLCRAFPHLQQLELRSWPTAAAARDDGLTGAAGGTKDGEDEEEEETGGSAKDWGHWGDWSGVQRRRRTAQQQQQPLDFSAAAGVWLPELQELTVTFTPLRTCEFGAANTPRLQRLTVIQRQDSPPLDCFHLQLPELTCVSLDGVAVRDGCHLGASLSAPACPRLRAFTARRLLGGHDCYTLALPVCEQLRLCGCEDLRGLRLWAPRLQLLDLSGCISLSRVELLDEAAGGSSCGDTLSAGGPLLHAAPERDADSSVSGPPSNAQQQLPPALSRGGTALAPAGPAAEGSSTAGGSSIHSMAAPPQPAAPLLLVDLTGTLASTATLQHLRGHPRVKKLLLPQDGAGNGGGGSDDGVGGGGAAGLAGASGAEPGGRGVLRLVAGAAGAAGEGSAWAACVGAASTAATAEALAAVLGGASSQY